MPEGRRFCSNCRRPVGRSRDGAPGRLKGYCQGCGEAFDFSSARPAQVIAGRYEVKGGLGRGGYGTALLAHDRTLGTDVVLKHLSGSPEVAATAEAERDALVALRHDNIVRIHGYEDSPEGRYLVLEYVRGTPLAEPEPAGERLEVVLSHGLQVLQALDYLHGRGLLHMDVKPANIIRFTELGAGGLRDRVRLIDFGAVRPLEANGPVGHYTPQYAPPRGGNGDGDPEFKHVTQGFDLFCLGATLRELCEASRPRPSGAAASSLNLLLDRATDTRRPERRFVSASQFADQLSGVLRQVVAGSPGGQRITQPSAFFPTMADPLPGGLGAPRPLRDWVQARTGPDGRLEVAAPFRAPAPEEVAAALPVPFSDPDDLRLARRAEPFLEHCRRELRRGDAEAADRDLAESGLPGWFWGRAWYAGLIALARHDTRAAAGQFQIVRESLPGELVPEIALGLCAEIGGDLAQARDHFASVADVAPALGAAGFGLARTLLLLGDRAGAVNAAQRLVREFQAESLRYENEARIARVRLLAAVAGSARPSEADLDHAQRIAGRLPAALGPSILVDAEILYGRYVVTGDWLPLSDTLRVLARELAATKSEMYALVDLGNQLRPRVTWRRPRGSRRARAAADTER